MGELGKGNERKSSLTFSRVIGVFEEIKGGQCRNSTKDRVSKIFEKAIGNSTRQISLKYRHRKFKDVFPPRFGWAEADSQAGPSVPPWE